jgi:hypothetical protein
VAEAIENLTRVTGRILERRPHPRLDGWDVVALAVEATSPVAGKADLLSANIGHRLEVAVRSELLGGARPGATLGCLAKFTPDGAMCQPHPAPGAFTVSGGGGRS